jgi:Cu(I)/Ag(I) efflux system membrane fusion protein
LRVVAAKMGSLASALEVTGTIDFNQRDVAVIQARSGGFVSRVYARAPGDVVRAGAPIADLLLPEWGGAQTEYLSVRRLGKPDLTAAARQRLRLMGMSDGLIASVERSGRPNGVVTITTPISGTIQTLDARAGVTLAMGQTLAQVSGLGTVWLNAAVPEARAGDVRVGQNASTTLAGFPGERFAGRVIAILPTTQADSRTLTVRIELPNRDGRLRPGMFASVALGGDAKPALLVPSEAVIRTGRRTLVMLAAGDGRYHPAEVRIGREAGGETEILAGLSPGENVVVSGQFLIDPRRACRDRGAADRRRCGIGDHRRAGVESHAVRDDGQDRADHGQFGDAQPRARSRARLAGDDDDLRARQSGHRARLQGG